MKRFRFSTPGIFRARAWCWLVALLSLGAPGAHAAPGDLDTSFGNAGKVLLDLNNGSDDLAWAINHDNAGNIYLAGQSSKSGSDFALVRLTAAGQLDTGFGSAGKVLLDIGSGSTDVGNALAFDAAGNVYVAGTTTASGNAQFVVVRLDHGGHLDSSFGSNGRAIVPSSSPGNESCCGIALDSSGAIYLVGAAYIAGTQTLKVARLTSAGLMDGNFGTLGISLVLFNHSTNGVAVIPDASGSVYVQASVSRVVNSSVNDDMALILLDHGGQPVTSFGQMGAAYVDIASFDLSASMARDAAGDFYLTGETIGADHVHFDFAVAKLDALGNPVAAFGSAGKKDLPITAVNGGATAYSVQLDRDGNLYLSGSGVVSNTTRVVVAALDGTDGSLMSGFGSNGVAVLDVSGGVYNGVGAVLDGSGRLDVVANRSDFMGASDFAALRLQTLPVNEIFHAGFELP